MNDYDLKQNTYRELLDLEDRLRLEDELATHLRPRQSGGRLVIFILSVFLWALLFLGASNLTKNLKQDIRGIVGTVLVIVTLGLAVVIARKLWASSPAPVRRWVRLAMHYWPVTVVAIVHLISLFKK